MVDTSSRVALFRERPDGDSDYFPETHEECGYRVIAAQKEQLLKLMRREQRAAVAVIALTLLCFPSASFPMIDSRYTSGFLLAAAIAFFTQIVVMVLSRATRRRLLKSLPRSLSTMTNEDLRYRIAENVPTVRIVLWCLLYLMFVVLGISMARQALIRDDLLMLLVAISFMWGFGRLLRDWVQILRARCRILKWRRNAPLVFD